MIKVTDSQLACHKFETSTTEDPPCMGRRCKLNLSKAQRSSRWYDVVVRRGVIQLRCLPPHLTIVQNCVVRRQKPSCSLTMRR
ncbi:hypothetical protein TNCV_2168271 [Trichonephila clavipes]|nr:hypothetical protein TNCV_2168271 [Trichonephila clavipes]